MRRIYLCSEFKFMKMNQIFDFCLKTLPSIMQRRQTIIFDILCDETAVQ